MRITLSDQQIKALRAELEYDEGELLTLYSGRGMYGDTCMAWVGHDPIRFAVTLAIVLLRDDEGFQRITDPNEAVVKALEEVSDICSPSRDAMGLDTVHPLAQHHRRESSR